MGQKVSITTSNNTQDSSFLSFLKRSPQTPSSDENMSPRTGMFAKLTAPFANKPNDFTRLISNSISFASTRTKEYLVFKDPESKFQPSPQTLTQVFLMNYIPQSVNLDLTDTFSCTSMTPEQRILLGADWVWAILKKPTKNPKIQIAVQVLHLPEREEAEERAAARKPISESIQMAQMESRNKNVYERMVDFCTSIGKDCYALFLFFGKRDDKVNIYGVLSNNFEAAVGKCDKIDRALIENFFKGSRYFHTPFGMMQTIFTKNTEALTLMIKFS
ncbi:rab15 effector protein [Girardinichthys multiradiatus]|uniref:rab15 effector protein n=1 Tax=Girardinichthys multiradiatus TaxID=208333 RepID=UPI001FABE5A7|nr:rab15 effector protein [Girardinichthys multiradiatus]